MQKAQVTTQPQRQYHRTTLWVSTMYLETRRKQGNTEYRNTTGKRRPKGVRTEYSPHRSNHTHSDEDDEATENHYSIAAVEPSQLCERGLTRQTSSYYRQRA